MRKLDKFGTWIRSCLILSILCIFAVCAQAQTVSGVVKDASGDAIIGATVRVSGTNTGTVTDSKGHYSITASRGSVLTVSYIGYLTKQIRLGGENVVDVVLMEDNTTLNDIVVVGYGTMKKSDITGSVVTVDKETMMKKSPTNIGQGLQGTSPGVMVTMQDGAPDSKAQIRIRGVATINGSAAPLYVVDGIIVGENADFLSPSDIESVDILKDASATAIYGSRGANGVIQITTKHGTKGFSNVNITADFGIQTLSSTLDVCDVDQYAANLRQARINDGQVDKSGNPLMWNPVWTAEYDGKRKAVDWQDQMTRAAWRQNYNVSTSGGNDKTTYAGSVGFLRNDGVVVNTTYQRITAHANVKTEVNKYLEFGSDVSFTHTDSHGSNSSVGNFGNLSSLRDFAFACPSMDFITSSAVTYAKDGVAPGTYVSPNVVNPDGTYGEVTGGKNFNDGFWGTGLGNMYAKQMENNGRYRSNRALANAYLAITPIEGLTWKTLVSYDYASSSTNNFTGGVYTQRFNYVDGKRINVINGLAGGKEVSGDAYYAPRNGNEYTLNLRGDQDQTLVISNTLTFHKKFDVHDITVMLGHEKSRWYGMYTSADATGFESQYNRSINLTTNMYESRKGNGELKLEERFVSYFGRFNYALMDRYLLTATLRRDGSSKFGVKNYWGTFPSVAAGWRISEEPFMKSVDWVSNLKLRFGWGQTGNSGKNGDYAVTGLNVDGRYVYYSNGAAMGLGNNPAVIAGFYPELKDPGLKWEANEQTNIGIDASLFNGQLVASVDYFVRTSKDLLIDRAIRATSGYQKIYTNYGEIENSGIEIMLGWNKRFNNDLSLNVTLTGSTLKNKVKKMGDPIFNTNSDSSGQGTGDGSNTGAVGSADGYHWGNHSICKEGEAVGSFYGYRTDGIIRTQEELDAYKAYFTDPKTGQSTLDNPEVRLGDYRFKDLNGDHKLNSSDMDILGNGFPTFNYGLNIGLTWKNWDANIQMHGVFGQDIYSYSAMRLTNMFTSDDGCAPNILKSAASDAWSPSNPNGSEARLSITDKGYNMRASDAWVKNGDFLKISNLQIGYNLPKDFAQKLLIQSARIYLGVQNLACISGYNKYGDPECGQGSVLYTGLDTGRYPMPRTYNFGVNVTF